LRDRNNAYGRPEDCFAMIADFWSLWLGKQVTAYDVGMCLALLKVARAKANPDHADNYTDLAGYAACSAEIMDRRPRAEGCEELVHDAPQTPEEVCRHIVDSNPATYGQPRTPTGEELAEMAEEEEKHG
jgi:hypothetical protein